MRFHKKFKPFEFEVLSEMKKKYIFLLILCVYQPPTKSTTFCKYIRLEGTNFYIYIFRYIRILL